MCIACDLFVRSNKRQINEQKSFLNSSPEKKIFTCFKSQSNYNKNYTNTKGGI